MVPQILELISVICGTLIPNLKTVFEHAQYVAYCHVFNLKSQLSIANDCCYFRSVVRKVRCELSSGYYDEGHVVLYNSFTYY